MRITGGQAKGILITAPRGNRIRPTSDKVREALFNTLGSEVADRKVLDLFAGTGALAIDALSRGAKHAVMIEKDSIAARVIDTNLAKAGLAEKAKVVRADYRSALRRLDRAGEECDLIFIDPPYHSTILEGISDVLAGFRVISPSAIIVVEHFKKTDPPGCILNATLTQTRFYGQTALTYYRGD